MDSSAYLSRLQRDIDRWMAAGLIEPATAEVLRKDAAARESGDSSSLGTLSILAAVAFILGALSLIAANWDRFGDLWQFGFILVVFNAVLAAATVALGRRKLVFGHAAALAAAAMFGGALILIGQTFSIPGALQGLMFWWAAGAAIIALALRSGIVQALSVALTFGWVLSRMDIVGAGSKSPFDIQLWLGGALLAAHLARAWRTRAALAWHVSNFAIWAWAGLITVLFVVHFGFEDASIALLTGLVAVILGAGAAAGWQVQRDRRLWGAGAGLGYAAAIALLGALTIGGSRPDDGVYAGLAGVMLFAAASVVAGAKFSHRGLLALGVIAFLTAGGWIYLEAGGSLILGGLLLIGVSGIIGGLAFALSRTRGKEASR